MNDVTGKRVKAIGSVLKNISSHICAVLSNILKSLFSSFNGANIDNSKKLI